MTRLLRLAAVLLLALLCACGAQPAAPAPTAPGAATAAPDAPTAAPAGGELNVFAAASLTEAFGEIGRAFESANPGALVVFNFAGSQQLAQQIGQGAPADVFASANRAQMNAVITSGEVISGTEQTFVRNRLVVITPKDNPAGITGLADLAKPGVKLILADKAVPVGQYALDFLAKASQQPEYTATYSATVVGNVVSYEENVRAVLGKVALGEGDAGIVYSSDVVGASAAQIAQIAIPDQLNTVATYPIAPLAGSANAALAQRFIEYVLSPEGQQTLARYGFIPATGG
ncbi:MAG TPA: molybdate ABC transporter substrate-binding protein [Roseiflexaceae bacterium]|nr:molybdate ABC transporter substrate-binding protein [Roseiflexaceae bacterium]